MCKGNKKSENKYFEKIYDNIKKESDVKGLYKLTNQLCQKKTGTTPQMFMRDGKILRKPADMGNCQLDFYI